MRKVLFFVGAVLLLSVIVYAQTNSLSIGPNFTLTAGTQIRNINSDDLLTTQQADAKYALKGAATPTPTPSVPTTPQYFGSVTLVNGIANVTFPTAVTGCRVTDRSGNSVKYGPTANAAVWQFSGVGPTLDYECR